MQRAGTLHREPEAQALSPALLATDLWLGSCTQSQPSCLQFCRPPGAPRWGQAPPVSAGDQATGLRAREAQNGGAQKSGPPRRVWPAQVARQAGCKEQELPQAPACAGTTCRDPLEKRRHRASLQPCSEHKWSRQRQASGFVSGTGLPSTAPGRERRQKLFPESPAPWAPTPAGSAGCLGTPGGLGKPKATQGVQAPGKRPAGRSETARLGTASVPKTCLCSVLAEVRLDSQKFMLYSHGKG